jgi:formylglycine-generating enzyme required for sulfatase activity
MGLVSLVLLFVASAQAAEPRCPNDMVQIQGFCIDRYEAPNQEGAEPLTARTAIEGERFCAEHGKRLCSEAEWVTACRGAEERPYPYGKRYKYGRCNDDKDWRAPDWGKIAKYPAPEGKREVERLYQADRSGSRPGCTTPEGVFDLTGNVAEWVTRSYPNRNNYPHVLKGCYWSGCYGGAKPSCSFVNPAHPGTFRTYEAGFRCCLSFTNGSS